MKSNLTRAYFLNGMLSYVYVGDHGPYLPPKEPVSPNYGRLLAGMYGITETSDHNM